MANLNENRIEEINEELDFLLSGYTGETCRTMEWERMIMGEEEEEEEEEEILYFEEIARKITGKYFEEANDKKNSFCPTDEILTALISHDSKLLMPAIKVILGEELFNKTNVESFSIQDNIALGYWLAEGKRI